MTLPKRKIIRLDGFDYSQDGVYFITICTKDHKCLLSKINKEQELEDAVVDLTPLGEIAQKHLIELSEKHPHIEIPIYVIMPNHIHIMISILNTDSNTKKSVSDFVCAYKSLVAIECNKVFQIKDLFQRSFFDHIIRNEKDYNNIFNYVLHNPGKWIYDRYYSE